MLRDRVARGAALLGVTRIAHAFCRQLDRLVTIDEARSAFTHAQDITRYDFYCAEPACAAFKIRIAGVNYRVDASTGRKLVENHFRRWDDHLPGCPYADAPAPVAGEADAHGRHGHRTQPLASELIDAFDPPVDDLPGFEHSRDEEPAVAPGHARVRRESDHPMPAAGHARRVRTSDLTKLVDTYREALTRLSSRELAERRLAIAGEGWVPLTAYFMRIGSAHEGPPLRVHYGGARLIRYYGRGFKLRFYDTYREKPVYLYVASAAVRTATESAVLVDRLGAMERGEYSTVYALGRMDAALDNASYSIAVTDLRRLVLHAPRPRRTAISETAQLRD